MLERNDYLDPARAPFGKPTTKLSTPNIFDLVVIEDVPISPETYRALPYKSPHKDYATNGLILVWQGPVKAANNQIVARRVYASESEAPENWYNHAIKYSADAAGSPIYVRSYITLREDYATPARGSTLSCVILLRVTNQGSGYTTAPTVAITGGGGSGATAKAVMSGDKVIGLQFLSEGTGYTTNPAVGFSGGGGTGAAATALIQPIGAVLVKEETTRLDSEDPQLASLFIRVHRFYETLPGPWVPFTRYDEHLGPIQGRRRSVLATAAQKASLTSTTKRTYEGRDGSSIVSLEIEETWTTGEGTTDNPAFPIALSDTYTDERGAVDRQTQVVVAAGDEELQEATLTRASGVVTKTWYEAFDEFHLKKVVEHWVEVVVNDKRVTSEFGGGILDLTERTDEPGAQNPDTGFLVVESRLHTKSPHEQTKITEKLSPDSAIPVLELVDGGSGFSTPPAVSFSGGTVVTPAVADAVLGFGLASITANNGGSGYLSPPAVGFINGGGGGAFATAVLGFGLGSVIILDGGGGYTSAPAVAVTGDGSGATGTAILGFAVASIAITSFGAGPWTGVPTVVFNGDGTGATANVVMGHPILAIAVDAAGSGYTSAPTVSVAGGGGTGGAGTAVLQFTVASATVTAPGSGYTSAPVVAFTGGGGSGAAGVVVLGFGVATATITAPGSGYASAPTVGFSGGAGTGAAGTAVLQFTVASATVTAGGSGYTSAPTVALTGGGGSGATATATIGIGVASATVTSGGSGYTSAPTVAITGGGGSGATATATIDTQVTSATVTANGSGYTSAPTVALTGGGGSGATAVAIYTPQANLAFVSDGDANGVLDFIGTDFGALGWVNPQSIGTINPIVATASGILGGSEEGIIALSDRTAGHFYTTNVANSWVKIDLGVGRSLVLNAYSYRSRTSFSGDFPTAWKLEGSNDNSSWTTIDTRSVSFSSTDEWLTTAVVGQTVGYRYFRLTQTALNSSGGNHFSIGELEFYGLFSGGGPSGIVTGVTITNPGTGYTSAPAVGFSGGGGTGATATAAINTVVAGVTITNPGSGYTSAPAIGFSGGGGSGATATAILEPSGTVKSIAITNPGSGYTSAPTIGLSGGGGTGATATAILSSTGSIKSVAITAPGTGYTSAPTIALTGGGGSGAAATAVLAAAGVVKSVTITNPGAGYTSAPTMAFTGGAGTGAAATAVLSSTGSVKSVTVTPGTGYTSAPTIGFSGGGGSGATATASLDETVLQPSRIDVVDPGSGYTSAPTISFVGGGGTGLAATATLATVGKVVRVNVTAAGTGYTYANIGFTGGAGSGASAAGIIETVGRVIRVDVHTPGSFRVVPTVVFEGGGGSGATATAVLAATGSVVELELTTPGLYTVAPTVVFTGAHTGAASAIYHIGSLLWPANRGFTTDPTEGIVVNHIKKVVPEGTPHPGRGNFVDMLTHDRWKSIQIVSAVDLNTLPLPETYWTMHNFHLPPTLLAIEGVWSDVGSKLASAQAKSAHVIVSSGASGGIIVRRTAGYHGYAKAYVTRIWFFGPPPESAVPLPLKIIGSSGSVVITSKRASTQYTNQDDGGTVIGDEDSVQVHALDVSDHLVGAFPILNATHQSRARNANARSGGGNVASAIAYGQVSTMTVSIPSSSPPTLISGQLILVEAIPQKWRFGVWVLELIYVRVP